MADGPISLYLLAASVLDRLAYRRLIRSDLNRDVLTDSGFSPVEVWGAMRMRPDLALVVADVATPDVRDALQMIPRLRRQTRILIVSASVDEPSLQAWGFCNFDGYVVKGGGVAELASAVTAVGEGREYFSAGVHDAVASGRNSSTNHVKLSRRETELLPLLARGMTLREAAQHMTVSYKTADSYRTSLLRKLGVRDRVELVRYAIRAKIVEP